MTTTVANLRSEVSEMKKQYEFHFRHILKDGTILKEGEKLPVTPASQAAFAEVARILIEARKKRLGQDPVA